ncbi:hypothetical protein Tdes44962_MAKER03583 [Teratosphaeria destructans]|uniref:Uncharacterized protein n=1 Tax=Teratosphaeria destructans TaxID=418781 RepID=A0A9W7SPP0_9PEZI|nr:hypothetical protein Tdes44962_MAKER03583 [Teratosphaeria destructans]
MRYLDWDALIFPQGSHVPLREFRTNCYLQQEPMGAPIPIVTCFVPSLAANSPFQLSLHSWAPPTSILGETGAAGYVPGTAYKWRVQVIVDGKLVCTEKWAEDTAWPKQFDGIASGRLDKEGKPLKDPFLFPKFHKKILSEQQWNASDDIGRIKIKISAGYDIAEGFIKLVDHLIFSFQHAPIETLQRSGIAWPHPNMVQVSNPLQTVDAHALLEVHGLPRASHEPEVSSRNTSSTYSTFPPSIYNFELHAQHHPDMPYISRPQPKMRLPSDQIDLIIDAINQRPAPTNQTMPPPPIPQRTPAMDRNDPSRQTDISMHADCTSYPLCISQDAEGRIVHTPPSPSKPAPPIHGRREESTESSSSPVKPRDFLSTVMDVPPPTPVTTAVSPPELTISPATIIGPESSTKKRTRSALRSLTLNDGSPEKKGPAGKPARKASRTMNPVRDGEDKENAFVD